MRAAIHWFCRVGAIVRRVIGAPDYEQYVAHMRARHPDSAPLTRAQFISSQLQARYERPGSRCC
jgi:uncharacterized short protein YbdD (DUF466 family)